MGRPGGAPEDPTANQPKAGQWVPSPRRGDPTGVLPAVPVCARISTSPWLRACTFLQGLVKVAGNIYLVYDFSARV